MKLVTTLTISENTVSTTAHSHKPTQNHGIENTRGGDSSTQGGTLLYESGEVSSSTASHRKNDG
ncbi:hypothetical protein BGZ76_010043, partial [Entomortierella beljakovae]